MPYKSVSEVPDSVPEGKKKQWMDVWNSAYDSCIKDGKSTKDCEASAFAQANGVVKKDSMFEDIKKLFRELGEKISSLFVDRALSLPDLYEQVWTALDERMMNGESTQWEWLTDVYLDGDQMFAIVAAGGKLYRSDLTIKDGSVSMGDMQEVVIDFKPVESRVMIHREKSGGYRMFLLTGSTVLNRNGEIDSTSLYQKMIARCEETGNYPFLDFFHLGENFYMGTADWLAVDGHVALASIPMEDNEVSRAMIAAYEKDPVYWGCSNSFYPTQDPEMWEVADGVKIPVYMDGIYHSITILPEKDACSLFTGVQGREEIHRMDKRVLAALEKLADEDEKVLTSLVSLVDGVNRSIEDSNLIHREAEAGTEEETPTEETPVEPPAEPPAEPSELEIGEEVVEEVAKKVFEDESWTGLSNTVRNLSEQVENLTAVVSALSEKVEKRFVALETSEEEKKNRYISDLPAGHSKTRVTYRPKEKPVEDKSGDGKPNLQEVANATLEHFND